MKTSESDLADWPAKVQTERQAARANIHAALTPHPTTLGEHTLTLSPYVDCQYQVGRASVQLQRLHVWPVSERGKGWGGKAVEAVKAVARAVGRPVTLTYTPDDGQEDNLRRFYKRHGFRFMGGGDSEQMIWRP